jgi:hypothetical protein
MRLTLTATEFVNLIACFLYDQVTHPDESVPSHIDPEWADFIEVLNRKGMRTPLLQYYLQNDPQIRLRYNLIKDTFRDNTKSGVSYIEIRNQKMPKEEETGLINKAGKFLKRISTLGLLK